MTDGPDWDAIADLASVQPGGSRPSGAALPPADWREQLERAHTRAEALQLQLEAIRPAAEIHPAELAVSCTCEVKGSAGPEDAPEPDVQVDVKCPAHGAVADLVAYGRQYRDFTRAVRLTLGDDRYDPWDDPARVALEAVRSLIGVEDVLERAGLPKNLGGVEEALRRMRNAEANETTAREESAHWRGIADKWRDEHVQLREGRNSARNELREMTRQVDRLTEALNTTTAQLNAIAAEARELRVDNTLMRAALAGRDATTPTEEATPDDPDSCPRKHPHA